MSQFKTTSGACNQTCQCSIATTGIPGVHNAEDVKAGNPNPLPIYMVVPGGVGGDSFVLASSIAAPRTIKFTVDSTNAKRDHKILFGDPTGLVSEGIGYTPDYVGTLGNAPADGQESDITITSNGSENLVYNLIRTMCCSPIGICGVQIIVTPADQAEAVLANSLEFYGVTHEGKSCPLGTYDLEDAVNTFSNVLNKGYVATPGLFFSAFTGMCWTVPAGVKVELRFKVGAYMNAWQY